MFHSLTADLAFWATLAVTWVLCWRAKEPPGMTYRPRGQVLAGRAVAATMLTFALGSLPALVAAALAGGRLA